MLEYDFDVIYRSGKEHVVPDFLSILYLVEMSTAGRVEDDQQIAAQKNKFFCTFKDRSRLLEQINRT